MPSPNATPTSLPRSQRGKILLAAGWILVLLALLPQLSRPSALQEPVAQTTKDPSRSSVKHPLDLVELLRQAMANFHARAIQAREYVYSEDDKTTKFFYTRRDTYEIMRIGGHPYRRHLKFNDQPLPPEEEKQEQERLLAYGRKLAEDEMKTRGSDVKEGAQDTTAANEADLAADPQERKMQEFSEMGKSMYAVIARTGRPIVAPNRDFRRYFPELPLEHLPDDFDVRSNGSAVLHGRDTFLVEARPKHAPKSFDEDDAHNFNMKIWIDSAEIQIMKIEGKSIRRGLLSPATWYAMNSENLSKKVEAKMRELLPETKLFYEGGTIITEEWKMVKGEAWLPERVHIRGQHREVTPCPLGGDIVELVAFRSPMEQDKVFSGYKKFHVDVRILPPH